MATLFKNFLAVDGEMAEGRYCSLRVEDGRITAVADKLAALPGDEVVDGERRMALIPGFVDMAAVWPL